MSYDFNDCLLIYIRGSPDILTIRVSGLSKLPLHEYASSIDSPTPGRPSSLVHVQFDKNEFR